MVLSTYTKSSYLPLDDPYYYLYFGSDPRPPSYWELEGKLNKPRGRVLRFDSFSKILSSGLRLGLVTGPKPIVDAINSRVSQRHLGIPSPYNHISCRHPRPICRYLQLLKLSHMPSCQTGAMIPLSSILTELQTSIARSVMSLQRLLISI